MKHFLYITLLIIVGCTAAPEDKALDIQTAETIIQPNYIFKLVGEVDDNKMKHVTSIEVLLKGKNNIHQVLDNIKCEVQENEQVIIEDLNFDGYNDVRVIQYLPATPNIPYFYWLYNPNTNKFERNMEMEKITSPALDFTNQFIISQWTKSRTHVGMDYYQFKGGQLVLQKQEVQEYTASNTYVLTVKKPMGDSLQVVKRELIKED